MRYEKILQWDDYIISEEASREPEYRDYFPLVFFYKYTLRGFAGSKVEIYDRINRV